MPGGNSQEHGGKSFSRFASEIERLVEFVRSNVGRALGRSAGAISSEASDAVNKDLITLDATVSAGGLRYLSAKLAVGVNVGPLRYFSANVDVEP